MEELQKAGDLVSLEEGNIGDPAEDSKEGTNEQTLSAEDIKALKERVESLEKENHHIKSQDGRKKYEILAEQQQELLEKMSGFFDKKDVRVEDDPLGNLGDDDVVDVRTLRKLMSRADSDQEKVRQSQRDENARYGRNYEKELRKINAGVDEDLHLQALKLVTEANSKYNVRSSEDPAAAAQINYYQALSSLGSQPKAKPNLKGDKNLPPAGSSTTTSPKKEPEMNFDQDTMNYIAKTGMSMEEARGLMKQ